MPDYATLPRDKFLAAARPFILRALASDSIAEKLAASYLVSLINIDVLVPIDTGQR